MTMTKKYKILGKYIKDMSSETPDIETYVFVRDYISKYQLNIDINSKPLKNKMIEINTILIFEDKQNNNNKGLLVARYFVGRDRDPDMWESVLVEDGDPNAWVDFGENDVLL